MFDNEILEMLRSGANPDEVANKITASLNLALEKYEAEEAAKALKIKEANAKEAELDSFAEILGETMAEYIHSASGVKINIPSAKEIRAALDPLMPLFAILKEVDRVEEKKIVPAEKNPDEILKIFLNKMGM